MLTAFTRKVSPALGRRALQFLERQEIDISTATTQHERHEACLVDLPDSMFVDEGAVIARIGRGLNIPV